MTEKDAVATADTISEPMTGKAVSDVFVPLTCIISAISKPLRVGADDGRNPTHLTKNWRTSREIG